MQLFKNPFIVATNLPGIVEILLDSPWPGGSFWEASVSQTFDGTYTDIHVFNNAAPAFGPIRSIGGFQHPGVTAAQLGFIQGQSKGFRSRGTSWIFGRADYDLGGPPDPLIEDAQFYLRLRRLDFINGGPAGSSPGAGTTYDDADVTKDFAALGVQSGDVLVIESGGNAGEYLIDTVGVGSLTLDGGTPLPGASGPEAYLILRQAIVAGGLTLTFLIPRPYWHHSPHPALVVEADAPSGGALEDSAVLALPGSSSGLSIRNQEAGGGTDLVVALDDDGPEVTIQPQDALPSPLDLASTHLVAVRGAGAPAQFRLVATY